MIVLSNVMWNQRERFNQLRDCEISVTPVFSRVDAMRFASGPDVFTFDGNSSPFNPESAIKTCRSKIDMHDLALNTGDFPDSVCVPDTIAYYDPDFYEPELRDERYRRFRGSVDEICMDAKQDLGFPLVVKPNAQSMSANAFVVKDLNALSSGVNQIFTSENRYDPDALIQEYVRVHKEFRAVCFDGVCHILLEKQGFVSGDTVVERSLTDDWRGSQLVKDEGIEAIASDVAQFFQEHLGLRYAGFDFALDADGLAWFFEGNSAPMTNFESLVDQDGGMQAIENLSDAMFDAMLS